MVGWNLVQTRRAALVAAVLVASGCFGGSSGPAEQTPISEPPTVPQQQIAPVPANLAANSKVHEVLQALHSLSQNEGAVLVGQSIGDIGFRIQEGLDDNFVALEEATGAVPAIMSLNYGYTPPSDGKLELSNAMLARHCTAGGIVSISINPNNPFTGGGPTDRSFADLDFVEIQRVGSTTFDAWRSYLDSVAAGLEGLRDEGVTVLWRPFHNMNTDEYWWSLNSVEFGILWRETFVYLTEVHDLDNLIWVFSPATQGNTSSVDSRYPGSAYVDVVAANHATADLASLERSGAYERLLTLSKPLALAEVGPRSENQSFDTTEVIRAIQEQYPAFAYFVFAHGERSPLATEYAAIVEQSNAAALMSHPAVLTLEKSADQFPACSSS